MLSASTSSLGSWSHSSYCESSNPLISFRFFSGGSIPILFCRYSPRRNRPSGTSLEVSHFKYGSSRFHSTSIPELEGHFYVNGYFWLISFFFCLAIAFV